MLWLVSWYACREDVRSASLSEVWKAILNQEINWSAPVSVWQLVEGAVGVV